ncbi:hypothetical protein QTP86_014539 [Hemibagrus guttatus]|nr:hypothetical protein QTP86_014539 [Hemibagrus guttatus]
MNARLSLNHMRKASSMTQKTQKKHSNKTDGWRLKDKPTEPGMGKSSGNLPRVAIESCRVREQLGGLRFDKALPGDKRLAKMVSIARSRAFREKEGKVLLEGKRLICDAMAAGASPQMLFFSRVERLRELPLDKLGQASLVKVKFEDLRVWSDLVTPQGVIAMASMCHVDMRSTSTAPLVPPSLRQYSQSQMNLGSRSPKIFVSSPVPLFLICDNVRDPGSLGTILRCAAAAGCDRVLLTQGCVDPWEPKVLRAAMGALFPVCPYSLVWTGTAFQSTYRSQ